MQRIINAPDEMVEETVRGFLAAHQDLVRATDNPRVLAAVAAPVAGKVGIVSGGGSGHEPAFIGYLGRNLLDAVAVGEIFSSPTARNFADAFKAADAGRGVACLYGNYAGDNLNVKLALKTAAKAGIEVKTVVANDDVPSAPRSEREKRRGVAGEIMMWKVGAAKAAEGADLDAVIATAQKAIDHCRSIGVGLMPCTIPAVGHPNFQIEPGKMEVGIGHHGEPGIMVAELESAAAIARRMCDSVLPDLPFASGDEVAILISGLGATPLNELYILNDAVARILGEQGIRIHRTYVGNYFSSLEMMGVSLSVMKLDDELKRLIDAECDAVAMKQLGPAR
jgi:dihydroxyacetone kinase-like protein